MNLCVMCDYICVCVCVSLSESVCVFLCVCARGGGLGGQSHTGRHVQACESVVSPACGACLFNWQTTRVLTPDPVSNSHPSRKSCHFQAGNGIPVNCWSWHLSVFWGYFGQLGRRAEGYTWWANGGRLTQRLTFLTCFANFGNSLRCDGLHY